MIFILKYFEWRDTENQQLNRMNNEAHPSLLTQEVKFLQQE